MATKRAAPPPLGPDDSASLLRVARAAGQPLEAAKIARLAELSRKATPAEVQTLLDQLVAAGQLLALPPAKPNGKPRYWDRDPNDVARAAIRELVTSSNEPLAVKDVRSQLALSFKPSAAEIAVLLGDLLAASEVYAIPAKTASAGPRYWGSAETEFARRSLLALLQSKGPQTPAKLKTALKWLEASRVNSLIEALLQGGDLYVHPPVGTSKNSQYGHTPPSPEPYLREIGVRLADVGQKLKAARVPTIEVRRAVMQLLESAGLLGEDARSAPPPAPSPRDTGVDLVALMKRIEPGAGDGALVTARVLRQAAGLSKADFDDRVLTLARQGVLSLHRHDFVSSLSPEEREELVADGQGSFYVGMALRRNRPES